VDSSPDSSPHFEDLDSDSDPKDSDSNSNPKDSDLDSDSKAKDSHLHPRKLSSNVTVTVYHVILICASFILILLLIKCPIILGMLNFGNDRNLPSLGFEP